MPKLVGCGGIRATLPWHSHLQTTQILNSLLGILTIQIYAYYTRFKNDPLWMKCWIAAAYLVEVLHQVFGSWFSYHYAVSIENVCLGNRISYLTMKIV